MTTSFYVALVQREREESMRMAGLARAAVRLRDCCRRSFLARLVHPFRRSPAAC